MKIPFYHVFLLLPFTVLSQNMPDKIVVDYDSAGNQIFRGIEIVYARATSSDETTVTTDNLVGSVGDHLRKTGYENSRLNYYPNPVQDKLTIEWVMDFKRVDHIMVSSTSGQRLQVVSNLKDSNTASLDFLGLATGVYYLRVVYMDRTEEVIKIIKK